MHVFLVESDLVIIKTLLEVIFKTKKEVFIKTKVTEVVFLLILELNALVNLLRRKWLPCNIMHVLPASIVIKDLGLYIEVQ